MGAVAIVDWEVGRFLAVCVLLFLFFFIFNDDVDNPAHRVGSDRLKFVPLMALKLMFCSLSIDERLPGGLAVSASSHLISSHEEGSEIMQTACREHTQSRDLETSRPRGLIRSNTKIGPVLDVKLHRHEGRYCIH